MITANTRWSPALSLQASGATFCAFSVLEMDDNTAASHKTKLFASCMYVGVLAFDQDKLAYTLLLF